MRQTCKHLAILLTVSFIVLFANLGSTRLWDRDEPRNAGCAVEMMDRGDYVVPMFNDELRSHKPVLLYWLTIVAYKIMGVNEFSARFWSALLAVGTALCTYAMGRRLFNAPIGLWAAIILLTSLMFEVAAHAATPDSTLIFFCTAAICAFVLGTVRLSDASKNAPDSSVAEGFHSLNYDRLRETLPWSTAIVTYSLLGFAMLAKGPIGLILPTAVLGMFLLLVRLPDAGEPKPTKRTWWDVVVECLRPFAPFHFLKTCWAMRPVTAIVCSMAIALPWYVWVGLRTDGDFLRGFFFEHNLARATQTFEGHRGSALFFYPLAILAGFFPWSIFAGPSILEMVARIRRSMSGRLGLIFCACWVGVWVIAFSCASTKLPSYVTPCYPALALATAVFVHAWLRGASMPKAIWPRLSLSSLILVGVVMMVVFPIAAQRYLPGDEWLGVVGLVPLVAGIVTWFLVSKNQQQMAGLVLASGAVMLIASFFGFVLVRVDRHQQSHLIIQAIRDRSESAEVGALECMESTWVFYGRWPVRELTSPHVSHDAKQKPMPRVFKAAPRPKVDVNEFLSGGSDRFVITTGRRLAEIQAYLPPDTTVLADTPYFLKNERLVVLGRATAGTTLAHPSSDTSTQRR